jgi:hypothetical protein
MNLSIRFKNNELFNSNDYTLSAITIIIINDIAFNVIIYIWYLLYSFGIITFANPFFALSITLIQNIIVYMYLLKKGLSKDNLIKYSILLIILKVIPLISLSNDIHINYTDVYITVYLYIIYILFVIIINDILMKKNIDVFEFVKKDIYNEHYDDKNVNKLYDVIYYDIVNKII